MCYVFALSEEDLYRGAEELSASQTNKAGPPPVLETTRQYIHITHLCNHIAAENTNNTTFVLSCKLKTKILLFCPSLSSKSGGQMQFGPSGGYSVLQRERMERKYCQKWSH